jgi:hypothetical protein
MKFVIFTIALVAGVPAIAAVTAMSKQLKRLAFAGMVVSFMLNAQFSINIMSMEYYRGPVRGFEITLADIVALGLILGMMLRTGSKIKWIPRLFLPLFTFFIFAIINVYSSEYKIYGWFVVWQLFRMGLMYWCVINFFATEDCDRPSIRALMLGYVITGLIMGLFAFKQKYLNGIYRIALFFDHSNTVPSFVLIILCGMLVWVLYDDELKPLPHLIALGANLGMVFAILATGSRTGMVTAAGSVVVALVIANHHTRRSRLRITTIFLVVCMAIGGLMVIDTVIDRFLNAPESSEEARNEFEIAAIMMADDYKIGVGLNQYSEVLTVNDAYRKHITVMKNEEHAGVAHHIYLLTAAEMGWSGMYFFIAIIVLCELSMVFYGIPWKSFEQRLLLGLSVGFLVLFAIGLYEWVIRQSPVLYQLVVATGFGQALITKVKQQKKAQKLTLKGSVT